MPAGRTLHSLRMGVDMLGTVGNHMWKAQGAVRGRHHALVMVLVLPHILKLVHRFKTFLVETRSLSTPVCLSDATKTPWGRTADDCEYGSTPMQCPASSSGRKKRFPLIWMPAALERTYFAFFLTNIARKQEASQRYVNFSRNKQQADNVFKACMLLLFLLYKESRPSWSKLSLLQLQNWQEILAF